MADRYKFGDVVEWITSGSHYARWIIVCPAPGKNEQRYIGVWIGNDPPPKESEKTHMGYPTLPYGLPYLVSDD